MTIQNRQLNDRLTKIQRCAQMAPVGTYETAREAADAVEEAIEAVRAIFREHGFDVNNMDQCRDLEASIYGYLLVSNENMADEFAVSEGFGEHVDGPTGSRILRQAAQERDAIRALTQHLSR